MCGATSAQEDLQSEQMAFYKTANEQSATTFAEDQAILKQMQDVYSPILAKGPNQKGFSDEERNNLDSQAIEGTADNYSKAARAVNESIAAEGGGNIPMPTGSQIALKEQVAEAAAREESRQQSEIINADYTAGRTQFNQASEALLSASHELNPTAYSNAATNAGSAASKTASDIAAANNSWVNAALGAAGSIGSAVVSENPGNIFG